MYVWTGIFRASVRCWASCCSDFFLQFLASCCSSVFVAITRQGEPRFTSLSFTVQTVQLHISSADPGQIDYSPCECTFTLLMPDVLAGNVTREGM